MFSIFHRAKRKYSRWTDRWGCDTLARSWKLSKSLTNMFFTILASLTTSAGWKNANKRPRCDPLISCTIRKCSGRMSTFALPLPLDFQRETSVRGTGTLCVANNWKRTWNTSTWQLMRRLSNKTQAFRLAHYTMNGLFSKTSNAELKYLRSSAMRYFLSAHLSCCRLLIYKFTKIRFDLKINGQLESLNFEIRPRCVR